MAGVVVVSWLLATWQGWHWPQRKRTKAATKFLSRHGLGGSGPATERLLVARAHGQYVAMSLMFGTLLAVIVTPLFDAYNDLDELSLFVWVGPISWLPAVGGAVGIGRATRAESQAPRVAHLPRPTVADHLPPLLRWWGSAMLAAAAVLVAIDVVFPPEVELLSSAAAVAALVLAAMSVLTAEGLARWLLRVPQAPTDTDELLLLDTLQGEAIGSVALGVIPTLLVGVLLIPRFPPGLGSQLLIGAFIVAMFTLERDRRRHLRDRLWPVPQDVGP